MALSEQSFGATALIFGKFDAEATLSAIEKYRVERGQFVPTMFTRFLKLPREVRGRYDHSSLRFAIHSAAPCPIDVKCAMIDWWGPIIVELYGGTETLGATLLDSYQALAKPGSVGKPVGSKVHICADDGTELRAEETGLIYFEGGANFRYLNDPAKTCEASHPFHPEWRTFGDIGRVDGDGYVYLTDRRAFTVISGGVNIYPQEAESALAMHPDVNDVAVFGVPDPDLGEQVKAVVQPADWSKAGPALEQELIAYCRSRLSTMKCPRSIDFRRELPRDPTGKMMKGPIRDSYWSS